MAGKVRRVFWEEQPMFFVLGKSGFGYFYSPNEIAAAYKRCTDHVDLALKFDTSPTLVRKLLDLAGVDYLGDLFREWQTTSTCADLAKKIRMKAQDLARKFRENGYQISRGPRISRPTQYEISKAVEENAPITSVAGHFGIHWQTAKKLLRAVGLLETAKRAPFERYRLAVNAINSS